VILGSARPYLGAVLLATACGGASPSLSRDVQPILGPRCGGIECHPGMFSPGRAHQRLVGVPAPECPDSRPYVVPGDPDHSYLYNKITGRDLCSGVRMPKDRSPLTDSELEVIASWIRAGAADD